MVSGLYSDMNTMVELTSFQALGRMQPFSVTMSSSAMAMIDIHAHLSTSEVVGYLAGQWDVTNHSKAQMFMSIVNNFLIHPTWTLLFHCVLFLSLLLFCIKFFSHSFDNLVVLNNS